MKIRPCIYIYIDIPIFLNDIQILASKWGGTYVSKYKLSKCLIFRMPKWPKCAPTPHRYTPLLKLSWLARAELLSANWGKDLVGK